MINQFMFNPFRFSLGQGWFGLGFGLKILGLFRAWGFGSRVQGPSLALRGFLTARVMMALMIFLGVFE